MFRTQYLLVNVAFSRQKHSYNLPHQPHSVHKVRLCPVMFTQIHPTSLHTLVAKFQTFGLHFVTFPTSHQISSP